MGCELRFIEEHRKGGGSHWQRAGEEDRRSMSKPVCINVFIPVNVLKVNGNDGLQPPPQDFPFSRPHPQALKQNLALPPSPFNQM